MMVEEDKNTSVAVEAPRDSVTADADRRGGKRRNIDDWLILFVVLGVPLFDGISVTVANAGAYGPLIVFLLLAGFIFGVATGGAVTAIVAKQRWSSSSRWLVWGLFGMYLFGFLSIYIVTFIRPS